MNFNTLDNNYFCYIIIVIVSGYVDWTISIILFCVTGDITKESTHNF